ncbi:MAG TPA: WD40 repeat domain-containing protein, partial [Phycisphaerae bacterium]|nr:WD40 repeat domain-containing protein [Phycisphaerae bacterium]
MLNVRAHFYMALWLILAIVAPCSISLADQSANNTAGNAPFNGRIPVVGVLSGDIGQIWTVAFVPNTHEALSAGRDGVIRLWDLN